MSTHAGTRLALGLAALAALALGSAPVRAGAPATPLVCQQVHTGTLSGSALFSFVGAAGDVVTVAAWRTDASGSLPHRVIHPDGTTLAGPLSFRQNHTLTQSGTHQVEVTGTGGFAIQLLWLSENASCQDDLACGVQEAATLTSEYQWRSWSFDGLTGQRIGFQTWRTGGDAAFAPRWRLYRPDGSWVQTAFQDGLLVDPTVVLDADGVHTIVARTETPDVGDLAASFLRFEDSVTPAFASCGALLLCGQAVGPPGAGLGEATAIAPPREWETFRVDAAAGETFGLSTWRAGGDPDFVPEHRLFDPAGDPTASFGAGFRAHTAAQTGTYTVAVRNVPVPASSGDFGIELARLSGGAQCASPLACGDVQLVSHDVAGTSHTFRFDAVAGDTVALESRTIDGPGLAVELALFEPDGSLAADFTPGRFEWDVAQSGTHTLVAEATSLTATGTFALFWEGLGPTNLCSVTDADLDSIPDDADNCPVDPNPGQQDADLDGVGDDCDNCPATANASQLDTDADSFGDACEPGDDETKCLVLHLKALAKMCKSAFACEAKRVKKPAKDPTGSARDACLDKAEERFDKLASKALNKLGPCLMPANYLTVSTALGTDALGVADSALTGFDEASKDDAKARSQIVKSMGKSCQASLKKDGAAVKKGVPFVDDSLVRFASSCDKSVLNSGGVYDGASCASLATLLEVLQDELGRTARGR